MTILEKVQDYIAIREQLWKRLKEKLHMYILRRPQNLKKSPKNFRRYQTISKTIWIFRKILVAFAEYMNFK